MGLFGGNKDNGYRPTRSTPLTKVQSSGRRVMRAKIAAYEPPPRNARQAVRRQRRDHREDYHAAREERHADRKGSWGLFSR